MYIYYATPPPVGVVVRSALHIMTLDQHRHPEVCTISIYVHAFVHIQKETYYDIHVLFLISNFN